MTTREIVVRRRSVRYWREAATARPIELLALTSSTPLARALLRAMIALSRPPRYDGVKQLMPGAGMSAITIRSITHVDGADLRAQVLRPDGRKVASGAAQYEDGDAIHLGAFCDGKLSAVVSFTLYDESGLKVSGCFQLRGAATAADARGQGVGSALISAGITMCDERNAGRIWCNGRSAARTFYERLGFRAVGAEFVTRSGPHYRFILDV